LAEQREGREPIRGNAKEAGKAIEGALD